MVKSKYNKKLIFDYIIGNDIEGITIEELENDYKFMIEVIKYTKDKNMYNLCSNEVKKNYEFVRFMVETFKDDIKFIDEIATNYLEQINSGDITSRELTIIMSNIIGDCEDMELNTYSVQSTMFYVSSMLDIEIELKTSEEYIGKKFEFVYQNYETSMIILNYIANRMLQEIFYNNEEYTFEELIHYNFKSVNELNDINLNNYLINYINSYDSSLSAYVSCHLELLDELRKNIGIITKNWDNYFDRINKRRIDVFNQELDKYIEENGSSINYSIVDFIDYVMKKLNLEETFKKYDDYSADMEMFGGINPIDENKLDLLDLKCLKYVTKLTKELFKEDIIDESSNDYEEEQKGKIIKYDFAKKILTSKNK